MDNRDIANRLTSHAHLLEQARCSLYRVRAYRRAAETVLGLDEPVERIVDREGRKGLQELDGIGRHLAIAIERLVRTGGFSLTETKALTSPPAQQAHCQHRPG